MVDSDIGRLPRRSRLPDGFVIQLHPTAGIHARGTVLFGGRPPQLLRLDQSIRDDLVDQHLVVESPRTARLARRLLSAGLARPVDFPRSFLAANRPRDIDIVIPVRDRDSELATLLAAVRADSQTATSRVIVVDDGSLDELSVRSVAETYAAEVLRLPTSQGPAAARNRGLAASGSTLVAFLDSDCVPDRNWLGPLIGHFTDPLVAIVAPRIVSVPRTVEETAGSRVSWLAAYEHAASALDMGPEPGLVTPGWPLSYVPSAAMLARRAALGTGFAERLRVAEDVDLAWRLVHDGWTIRYEPRAEVAHQHRIRLRAFLTRRTFYGTSGAMLGQRYGNAVAPVVLDTTVALASAGLLLGRGWSVAGALGLQTVSILRLARVLESHEIPTPWTVAANLIWRRWFSSFRYLSRRPGREYWPLSLAVGAVSPALRRRLVLMTALDTALASQGWAVGRRRRSAAGTDGGRASGSRLEPAPSLVGFLTARRLEDLAYGAGVWAGAWQTRSSIALRPRLLRGKPGRR